MRIALNLLYLIPGGVGGTETYARSLIRALAELDRENHYLVFVNAESAALPLETGPNFQRIVCPFRAVRRPVRYAWEQAILPPQLVSHHADLVHSLGYVGPIFTPCPHVVTIPDLNYIGHAKMRPARRAVLRLFGTRMARRAARVLTISNFSRAEIGAHLNVPPAKITVTHLAPRADGGVAADLSAAALGEKYGFRSPYIIAFSSARSEEHTSELQSRRDLV